MKESDLCQWFQDVAHDAGYTVYNEWGGYDQIVVQPGGIQIGVEAKLRANVKVLHQAIRDWPLIKNYGDKPKKRVRASTHYRAVLVPKATKEFEYVASALGVMVFSQKGYGRTSWSRERFWSPPSRAPRCRWGTGIDLPPVIPDVIGGKASPLRLTPWKIKAIRLCIRLREKGYLTSRDFKEFKVSQQYWRVKLLKTDGKEGSYIRWIPSGNHPLPDEEHPQVTAQLREAQAKAEDD